MKRSPTIRNLIIASLLMLLAHNAAFAGVDPPVVQSLFGSLNQIAVDSSVMVQDDKFFDTSFNSILVKPYMVRNTVSLKLDENSAYAMQTSFTATVTVRIIVTNNDLSIDSFPETLFVTYDPSSYVHYSNYHYTFNSAYRVTVKIIDTTAGAGWNVWKVLILDNELQSFPVYTFSCTSNVISTVSNAALSSSGNEDELPVSWGNVSNADVYDLEWTYIDSSALANGRYGSPTSPTSSLIFANNSSRVTITGTTYSIPMFYDGAGSLFFRVRTVQLQVGGGRSESEWSSDVSTGGLGRFDFKGHQRNFNWQATTSYAEEGKRKTVVQYYDGSLRQRQTVTKDNSTGTVIVAESFYDYQGRPAIQVMPAPTINTIIQYAQNFNLNSSDIAYDKSDFDSLSNPSLYCNSGASPMSSDSGAARYYSSSNPEKDSSFNQYIPQANGYPFTETQYTQDNTGRIAKQGGLGDSLVVGSNHETVYYYGTPDKSQLDGLFGTEVGLYTHYFKTMVKDANGQYSVSYTDMHGRTIATALAGSAPVSPAKLDQLPNYNNAVITETIADSSSNFTTGMVMESKKSLLITTTQEDTFSYSLSPQTFQLKGCDSSLVCYDCLYTLEITITDNCNNQNLPGSQAFDTLFQNFSLLSSLDTACTDTNGFTISFRKTLLPGSYDITKKLTVSHAGDEYFRDSIYLKKNTCKTQTTITTQQASLIAAANSQCEATCQSCSDSLGTYSSFYTKFMQKMGIASSDTATYGPLAFASYQNALADCKTLCDSNSDVDDIRTEMLLDLTPTGQYANVDSTQDKYSIFHADSTGSDTVAIYAKVTNYQNELMQPDSVFDESSGEMVAPQQLNAQSFATKFKSSWANALLSHHPEYCKLQQYEILTSSAQWDLRFESTDSYDSALKKGYLDPTHIVSGLGYPQNRFAATGTADYDPLASIGSYGTWLSDSLRDYRYKSGAGAYNVSMWAASSISIKCATSGSGCASTNMNDDSAFTNMCPGDMDMAWRNFREMYLNVKRELINGQLKDSCTGISNPSAATLVAAGHQPHFTDAYDMYAATGNTIPGDTTSAKANAQSAMTAYYDSNCVAYATQWLQQLSACTSYSPDSINLVIIPRLVQVCEGGADPDHPYGASSVSPGGANSFKSFEDVINNYNQTHNITDSVHCNAYVITEPKAYDQQVVYSSKPLWTAPDSCECSHINQLYQNYQIAQTSYSSFSNYLSQVYQTTIPDSSLTQLLSMCNGSSGSTCTYLQSPIQLPPALQCSSGNTCVNCLRFKQINDSFSLKYPGIVPVSNPSATDSAQLSYNLLYEEFMNYKLGFSKHAGEYIAFMDTCNSVNGASSPSYVPSFATLDSLVHIETHFTSLGGGTGRPPAYDASGCDTSRWKVDTAGSGGHYNIGAPLGQIITNGIMQLPQSLINSWGAHPVPPDFDHYNDTLCTDSNFTVEFNLKVPDTSFFNGSGLGASWWIDIYGDTLQAGEIQASFTPTSGLTTACFDHRSDSKISDVLNTSAVCHFNNWSTVKFKFRDTTLRVYFNDTLIFTKSLDKPVTKVYGFTVTSWSVYGAIDYVRVYDTLGNYYYDEEFKGCDSMAYPLPYSKCANCFTSFVNYFNQQRGTSYSGDQVDSLYLTDFGTVPTVCPITTTYSCDTLSKYYNSFLNNYDSLIERPCSYASSDSSSQNKLTCCQQKFLNYLNAKLGSTLTYQQMLSLYSQCSIFVSPCTAPPTGPTLCGRSAPLFPPVALDTTSECADSSFFAISKGTEIYNGYVDSLQNIFDSSYRAKCLNAYKFESFTVKHQNSEYQYTLYYYDQAGNLVKTVPPAGVNANFNISFVDSVETARVAGTTKVPSHTLITQYRYNTLNQVVAQKSPDGGLSDFWYDRLGRLAISQNAKQQAASGTETGRQYSYTLYDVLGRITEVGQISNAGSVPMTDSISRSDTLLNAWIFTSTSKKQQITQTVYDTSYWAGILPEPVVQRNLRNRVSYSTVTNGSNPFNYNQATFYTYDAEGNVDTLLQDYGNGSLTSAENIMNKNSNRFKHIVYQYDLVSGKVTNVAYQPHYLDQFYHSYTYDAENRLTQVLTSEDSVYWETDARYQYYKHGPLSRVILGEQQVQGLDYAYTLQGWLKGVNSTSVNPIYDMGNDGDTASINPNKYVGADLYGYNLNYFSGDYSPINGNSPFPGVSAKLGSSYRPLYNGNISSMGVNIQPFYASDTNTTYLKPLLYNYNYDQLNRLTGMSAYYGLNQHTNNWDTLHFTPDYKERAVYDANGNITTYIRYNYGNTPSSPNPMDSLTYTYNSGTNQLNRIHDKAESWIGGYYDIHDEPTNNYSYDQIGNIIKDSIENITAINWNVYGKITNINHSTTQWYNDALNISYTYDAAGNRISKRITTPGTSTVNYTWYVRDASGNMMATYTGSVDSATSGVDSLQSSGLSLDNYYLYGSTRIGQYASHFNVHGMDSTTADYYSPWNDQTLFWFRGEKQYELDNHLGNVLVTVSDDKIGVPKSSNSSLIDHYVPVTINAQDYYPFGMLMQGRLITSFYNYYFGFNGKEKDDEAKGSNNQIDYGARVYDPRAGRFLSVDPITKKFPELSPFQFASNRPIQGVDLDGKEVFLVTGTGNFFGLFAGYDIGGGIAFGNEGIALIGTQSIKIGFGLELGATINATLYPTMQKLDDLKGISEGFSAGAADVADFGIGGSYSAGNWGGTISGGIGVGGHASGDFSFTLGLKIIKWQDVVKYVVKNTVENESLRDFFGITESNANNSEQIVKDYFKTMSKGLINKRVSDLKQENTNNSKTIKNANDFLQSYKKQNWISRIFTFSEKVKAESEIKNAKNDTEENDKEIQVLKNTEIKL